MNRLPSANLFTTKTFVGQKLATAVSEHATSIRKGKTSGYKRKTKTSQKNKTAQTDKSEKDKKNSKERAEVTAKTTDSKEYVVDTGTKTKNMNSSKTAKNNKNKKVKKNSKENLNALKSDTKEKSNDIAVIPARKKKVANNESKKVDTKNRSVRQGDNLARHEQATKKMCETLPRVATAGIEDHPLDYSPEALLVDHEEVYLHDKEDASHLVGGSNVLEVDPHLGALREQSAEEEVDILDDLEDVTESPFDDSTHIPKRYREGTAGGKLFEEQTLAEIDGYLYLGKVGSHLTCRPN